ncbi:TPA: hypothetical protein N0F65_010699, partial [Lagenidium giganteum]
QGLVEVDDAAVAGPMWNAQPQSAASPNVILARQAPCATDELKAPQLEDCFHVVSGGGHPRTIKRIPTQTYNGESTSLTKRAIMAAKHYAHKLHEWKSAHQYLGRYSVQKLLRFDEYRRTTSLTRVLLWIMLTPVPSLLLIIAVAAIPLENPLLGPAHNPSSFAQSAISYTLMTFALLLFMRTALGWIDNKYPHWVALVIAVLTAACNEAVMVSLAFAWRFPVPFRDLLGMIPFASLLVLFHMVFLGKFMLRNRHQLAAYLRLFVAQCLVLFAFVAIALIFRRVAYSTQVALTLLFPCLRVGFKRLIWRFAGCLDDISTDISVCVIEIFGSLYQNSCLQNVRSPEIGALMVLIDFSQALIDMRMYLSHKFIVDGRTAIATVLKIVEAALSFVEYDDEEVALAGDPAAVVETTKKCEIRSVSVMLDHPGLFSYHNHHRRYTVVAGASSSKVIGASEDKVEGASSAVPQNRRSIDLIELNHKESAKLLEQTLELLYSSEVLLFVEYVEVALPVVFGIYTGVLSQLPYAAYSTAFIGTTSEQLTFSLASTAIYTCCKALSLVLVVAMVQRKYGLSALYQLGFVLETYWPTIQGKLMGSLVLIFNLSTVHHGLDLSLQFDWERQVGLDHRESAKLLEQKLQLLFASEVIAFVEYVEVALPIVNGIYTAVLSQLSYAAYSTAFIGTPSEQMSLSTAVYPCFDALMVVLVERKYCLNALYQLSFVLEAY